MGGRFFGGFALDLLVLAVASVHVVLTPYGKVEESFNLQATHDVLHLGWAGLARYDHHAFPGVVPRTFVGALVLAAVTAPIKAAIDVFGDPFDTRGVASGSADTDAAAAGAAAVRSKMSTQVAARIALAALVTLALVRFRRVLRRKLGAPTAAAFALLTVTQFHLPFYMSRTLPNTFALVLTTLGAADWYARGDGDCGHPRRAVFLLTAAAVVFRCDAILLLAPVGIHMLATRAFTIPGAVAWGACCILGSLAATVSVDTVMWRPPEEGATGALWPGAAGLMWPEGRVAWFNTVENRSGEWGNSPPHWYVTSALPRSLLVAYPLAVVGALVERRVRVLVAVATFYIAAYSFLPHKELRFIFPVLPLLNAAAAAAAGRVWINRGKTFTSKVWTLAALAVAGAWALSLAAHFAFALAARHNYPGGVALARLHAMEGGFQPGLVHVDAAAAMTGVSRFGEARGSLPGGGGGGSSGWRYSKEEGVPPGDMAARGFDHLVSGAAEVEGFEVVDAVEGFVRLALDTTALPPLRAVTTPQIYIHRRVKH